MKKEQVYGAAYVRSATDNVEQIEEQEELIEDYCWEHRIRIVKTYKDIAQSGMSLQRPALNQLIADAAAGHFSVVITTSPDRIARDISVYRELMKRIEKYLDIDFSEVLDYEDDGNIPMDCLNSASKYWFNNDIENEIKKS
jgi:DNA invertase Pin-like site-specific DNA recombinase